jgi:DNA polymerase-3 subunit delta'
MMFDHLIGNTQVKEYLTHTVRKGMAGNSLLFAGPDGVGKSLFAEAFAKLLICQNDPTGKHRRKIESGNHPDIRIYRPEGKVGMHSIASIRLLSEEVALAPYEAERKIFIIHDAERMLPYSANALLKTFEEPSPDTVIILVSSAPAALLPTVLSRCRIIHFRPIAEDSIARFLIETKQIAPEQAAAAAAMAEGSIGHALKVIDTGDNPVRKMLLEALVQCPFSGYKPLADAAAAIAEAIDEGKKGLEAEVRKGLLHGTGEDLTASQKQAIEKEVEGVVAMHGMEEAFVLFEMVLAWYRDIQLIGVGGNPALLFHRDQAEQIALAFEKGNGKPLELVEKAIEEARLALQRSTSLQICLENLFLKLNEGTKGT